ncbi:hypothetical protein E4K10_40110 [Streptomyces sp. T1317-0309]|nr:hypothetical protein E4K10_40110 [Streptomyces sp. T1317-0309]
MTPPDMTESSSSPRWYIELRHPQWSELSPDEPSPAQTGGRRRWPTLVIAGRQNSHGCEQQ